MSTWRRDARQISAKVRFNIATNNDAVFDYATSPSSDYNNLYSNMPSVVKDNKIYTILEYRPVKNVGYFDTVNESIPMNKSKLASMYDSGTYSGDFNIEYSSKSTSDDKGVMNNPVVLQFMLKQNRTNKARYIEIVGMPEKGEYPKDFTLLIPKTSGDETIAITNNNNVHIFIDLGTFVTFNNSKPFVLTITKWSKPYSSVKMNYVGFDMLFDITNNDVLLDFSTDAMMKNNGDLSYGLKYNKANINFYSEKSNTARTSSGVLIMNNTTFMINNRDYIECYFYIKNELDKEYSKIATYVIDKVDYNSQSEVVNCNLYDKLKTLQSIEYPGCVYGGGSSSLYDILIRVLEYARLEYDISYNVPDNIKSNLSKFVVTREYLPGDTIWNELDYICQAAQLYIITNSGINSKDVEVVYEDGI